MPMTHFSPSLLDFSPIFQDQLQSFIILSSGQDNLLSWSLSGRLLSMCSLENSQSSEDFKLFSESIYAGSSKCVSSNEHAQVYAKAGTKLSEKKMSHCCIRKITSLDFPETVDMINMSFLFVFHSGL